MWNPAQDEKALTCDFILGHYQKAAPGYATAVAKESAANFEAKVAVLKVNLPK